MKVISFAHKTTQFWFIWKAVLNVPNNCYCNSVYVCMYLCMYVFCGWAGFTEQGGIISYAVSFCLIAKQWKRSHKSACLLITDFTLMRYQTLFSWEISLVDSGSRYNMLNNQQEQEQSREHPFWSLQQRICGTQWGAISLMSGYAQECLHALLEIPAWPKNQI